MTGDRGEDGQPRLSRRRFAELLGLSGAAALAAGCQDDGGSASAAVSTPPAPTVPLTTTREPTARTLVTSADAIEVPTACDYCIVGCGYKAIAWPVADGEGDGCAAAGPAATVSPNAHNIVMRDGVPHHVVVIPDPAATVVNPGGDYGNGGALAQKLFNPDTATRDRLQAPRLRVGYYHTELAWEDALDIAAGVIAHARERHDPNAFGVKSFTYNYYENTYAITKLMFDQDALESPCWAPHDQPAHASSAPGLSDAGVDAFSASYGDWKKADVIFVSGVSLVEARPVLFQNWVKGPGKLIVVNPRRDATAAYAAANGGLHLQIIPGTDTLLHNALARAIVERGWQDSAFIERWIGTPANLHADYDRWRRQRFASGFDEYRDFLLANDDYRLEHAAAVCGLTVAELEAAVVLLTGGGSGPERPRASFMLEKGNYWGFNYENTASFVSLGLLCGAGNREGQVISRGGGHQRGMLRAAGYPHHKIPDGVPTFEGYKVPFNLDSWAADGNFRAFWVIGTTWFAATASSRWLRDRVHAQTVGMDQQLADSDVVLDAVGRVDVGRVLARLKARMDAGGMVLMQSDVYSNAVTPLADLVFPASGWGEHDFTRMQGERRLRMYSRIADPPGQARPDWWIVAQVAQRLGLSGFDWPDGNAIFEEAALASRGRGAHNYGDLVEAARAAGMTGHEYLRARGTTGVQCPVRLGDDGELVETVRMHERGFATASGAAFFVLGNWATVKPRWERLRPRDGQLWLTNMRTNAWQSLYDDCRNDFRNGCLPDAIVQLHPADAAPRGIANGDEVRMWRDDVRTANGEVVAAEAFGMAHVTEDVPAGVMCGYFNFRGMTRKAVNSLTDGDVDPVNGLYAFKLSRASVEGTGAVSPHAGLVSFVPRSIFGGGA